MKQTTRMRYRRIAVLFVSALMLGIALLTGCGSSDQSKAAVGSASSDAKESVSASMPAEKPQSVMLNSTATAAAPAPASTPAPPPAPGSQGMEIAGPTLDRKIIYKANVAMEVESYGDAHSEINNLVHLAGGYMLQFSESRTDYERSGTLTVKVPSAGFTSFLAKLEQMKPKTIQRSVQGQDVTEEFVDLDSRLKSKLLEEARLLDFMSKAVKSEELVAFSSQISKVQTEIEQIKGRQRYLEQNVAYSTIEIRLYEKVESVKKASEESKQGLADRLSRALKGSAKVVAGFFEGVLIVLAGALPVLIVLVIAGIPAYAIYRKRRKLDAAQAERARQIRLQNNGSDNE